MLDLIKWTWKILEEDEFLQGCIVCMIVMIIFALITYPYNLSLIKIIYNTINYLTLVL